MFRSASPLALVDNFSVFHSRIIEVKKKYSGYKMTIVQPTASCLDNRKNLAGFCNS